MSDSMYFYGYGFPLGIENAYLPLILRWDNQVLTSDLMPYDTTSLHPEGQAMINWFYSFNAVACGSDQILITDTITSNPSGGCHLPDSVVIYHENGDTGKTGSFVSLSFSPWMGFIPVSVEEIKSEYSIKIFPNPSIGEFNLSSEVALTYIACFDVFGREIFFYSFENGINHYSFDLKNFNDGIYLIKAGNKNKSYFTEYILSK